MQLRTIAWLLLAMAASSLMTAAMLYYGDTKVTIPPPGSGIEFSPKTTTIQRPYFFYAARSGATALDKGRGGGNPFADAVILAIRDQDLTLSRLSHMVAVETENYSRDERSGRVRQVAEVPCIAPGKDQNLSSARVAGSAAALVVVVSTYQRGIASLEGARVDASRIGDALRIAGFDTKVLLDASSKEIRSELQRFAKQSSTAEVAAIYVTGHGTEIDGEVYLVPREYRRGATDFVWSRDAFSTKYIAQFARAARANLVFFGGCRDNSFLK